MMEDVPESQVGESEAGEEVELEKKLFLVRTFVAIQPEEARRRLIYLLLAATRLYRHRGLV